MPRAAALLPTLLLALLPAACAHVPAAHTPRPAPGPDVPTPAYYDAGGAPPAPLERERLWKEADHELWRVTLPPRVPADLEDVPRVHDPIEILLMEPSPPDARPRPLILMFPILNNGTLLMGEFASAFVEQGYLAAIVPRKEVAFEPRRAVRQAEAEFRVQIMRGRQALDWLATQPRVDGRRLGMFGISAGAMLGVDMMGADPRLKAGVFVFAGGPMADVILQTEEGRFVRRRKAIAEALGWSRERMRADMLRRIRTDPIRLAPRVPREGVLLFMASDDASVPTATQRALWEALGRPEAYELPGGHHTGIALHLPFLMATTRRFLGRRLGAP
jgi:dienelactone hydrolase